MAEYGISIAAVSNWVCSYREECQNNDEEKSQLEMVEELRRLWREKAELEKENSFLKKTAAFFAKEINRFIRQNSKITYTAKGTPKLVLSSDLNTNAYILHDRDSSNGKCMHTNIPAEMYCGRSPCVE